MKLMKALCILVVVGALREASAAGLRKDLPRPDTARHLLSAALTPANRWINNVRAGATTAAAINTAVEEGGNLWATRRAGHIGSQMAAAAANPDQDVFDAVDRDHSDPWSHWGNLGRKLHTTKAITITPADRPNNAIRAAATTAQAIQEAVDMGGTPLAVRRAGHVGKMMGFAAAQGDQEVFNTIDNEHSDRLWGWGRK